MLIEEPHKTDDPHAASSCPSSISPLLLTGRGQHRDTVVGYRSMTLLYSSRERLDELATGPGSSPGSASSSGAPCSSSAAAAAAAAGSDGDRVERVSLGGLSVGSHDSREGGSKSSSDAGSTGAPAKEKSSKGLGAFIDKAKHRLGGSKERDKRSTTRGTTVEIELGNILKQLQEALQHKNRRPSTLPLSSEAAAAAAAAGRGDTLSPLLHLVTHHLTTLPFSQTRLYAGAVLLAMTMAWPGFLVGLLWGMYISGVTFLFFFVSEPMKTEEDEEREEKREKVWKLQKDFVDKASEVFEDAAVASLTQPIVVYRGWMNELPSRYDPMNYHVNNCRCVLVRLEGATLRISRPSRAVLKHAFHTDPTLTAAPPSMVSQSIYDLTEATISLRPRRLARLRWWSRKYPIYIRLKDENEEGEKKRKRRKRSEVPRIKRSISMHPSSSSITEAAAAGVEKVRREEDDLRVESEEEWTTTDSEWEDESEYNCLVNGVARTRSSTEISGVGVEKNNANGSTSSSIRRSDKRKPRGIYLFARAAREKERWFHLLREASAKARITRGRVSSGEGGGEATFARSQSTTTMVDLSPPLTPSEKRKRRESSGGGGVEGEQDPTTSAAREFMLYRANQAHFARSMSEAMGVSLAALTRLAAAGAATSSAAATGGSTTTTPASAARAAMMRDASLEDDTQSINLGSMKWQKPTTIRPEGNDDLVASVNAIAGRIFFDFCRDEYWCAQVKEKIQTKLATIHLPYFIENLELSSLDLGTTTPHIESVHAPSCDEWGLWVDFEMKYSGGIRLALETRVNLLKLQSAVDEGANPEESLSSAWARRNNRKATRYSDEDLPESPEDSPDEDFGAKMSAEKSESTGRERAASKIVSLVESAARSSIFQKAAKLSKVAKVINDISSTRLILNVEVEAIEGTMTINLPPPPSDRIWYAFRKRPKVSIRAVPQVGDRSVDLTTVSDWIESKLRLLIEKNLVCPNMDDIIIPVMSGNELLKMNYNR
ncbi:hypothetical protein PFISCL1PPCAC_6780 [Pristionchus fissidentatus]|uniref:SMP-LTD domain-containing protein n=1 Tax=Pristionchus fissidentatus TaxID=1538716 RepID=A0AAV5V8F4_9BILA|nr:hypothetical protein PFISCL1PPCAC_6780 [Pristionchus fissidentatus]